MKQLRESHADRIKQYELQMKHYELRSEHYRKTLDLYENNYEEYVKRIEAKYDPPALPIPPNKPDDPPVH